MNKVKEKKTKKIDKLSAPETVADAPVEFGTVPKEDWPYELPDGWKWERLGQVGIINMGQSPEGINTTADSAYTPLVGGPNDMGDVFPNISRYTTQPTKVSKNGDLIVSVRATLGKINISDGEYCLGRGVAGIEPKSVTVEFMSFFFKNTEDKLYEIASGTTFLQLSKENLFNLNFPLPPLPEQKRIVAKLESMLGKIKEARELIQEARDSFETRRAAILAKAFTGELTAKWRSGNSSIEPAVKLLEKIIEEKKALSSEDKKVKVPTLEEMRIPESDWPYEVPEGWEWCNVNSISTVVTGTTPKTDEPENYGDEICFFKPSDLEQGYDVLVSIDKLSKIGAGKVRLLPAKSIMVTCIGATIGKTGFSRVAGATNQQINSIIPFSNLSNEYAYYYCISPQFQSMIINNASATTLPILNKSRFENLFFCLPPLEEQKEIVRILDKLLDNEKEAKALTDLEDQLDLVEKSILSKAFRGELVTGENDVGI